MMIVSLLLGMAVVLTGAPDLDQLRWHNRVVLLFARDKSDTRLTEQKNLFEKNAAALSERQIRVFEITGASSESLALRTKLHVPDRDFAVVLIGKDGTSKFQRTEPVAPAELFLLIDSMPMRRNEMQGPK